MTNCKHFVFEFLHVSKIKEQNFGKKNVVYLSYHGKTSALFFEINALCFDRVWKTKFFVLSRPAVYRKDCSIEFYS